VSQSATSQTVRALERRLDLKLLNRTTRSVSATEAGERLYQTVGPRFADIEEELAALGEMRGKPAGTVRITATKHAARTHVWPRLQPWLPKYPDIKLEISSDNRFTDIVAERFDIGVRLGADVARDMIAVRMAPDMQAAVVGRPDYFARHPQPRAPQDLGEQDCIGRRLPTPSGLMNWEFAAALAGQGLAWVPCDLVREHMAAGRLVSVLDDFLLCVQQLGHVPLTQSSHGRQALKLCRSRAAFALLPVVDRLARHANESSVVCSGECQLAAMHSETGCAESPCRPRLRFRCLGIDRRRMARGALGNAPQFLFQSAHLATQRSDRGAIGQGCLLERFDFCANLFPSYARDLGFQDGCNVWHADIVPISPLEKS
jgi:DNA-binding transcriptional LysR family regulator